MAVRVLQTYSSLQAGTYQFSVYPSGGSASQAATSQVSPQPGLKA